MQARRVDPMKECAVPEKSDAIGKPRRAMVATSLCFKLPVLDAWADAYGCGASQGPMLRPGGPGDLHVECFWQCRLHLMST